jgi:hypothetical protein
MTPTPPRASTPPPYKKKDGGGVAALPFSLGFSDPAGGVMAGFGGVGGESISVSPEIPTTLPADLAEAATRVCIEIHGDGPEAVAAMLADLATYPEDSWAWLTEHFKNQLPALPADPALVITCGGCTHSEATQHPAILACAAGVPSGLPIGGRWATDRHHCPEFTDRVTGRKPAPINTTREKTQTTTRNTTRDPFNPFD